MGSKNSDQEYVRVSKDTFNNINQWHEVIKEVTVKCVANKYYIHKKYKF